MEGRRGGEREKGRREGWRVTEEMRVGGWEGKSGERYRGEIERRRDEKEGELGSKGSREGRDERKK